VTIIVASTGHSSGLDSSGRTPPRFDVVRQDYPKGAGNAIHRPEFFASCESKSSVDQIEAADVVEERLDTRDSAIESVV
jgi:hypothetical protein